jgi:glycosyltransferase involved in cell wall biosynthesis
LAAVGRIEIAKGIDVLIETLGAPPWPARPWRLRLYGDCAQPAFFRELAALCGIGGRVEFCGHQADVRRIWAENHLLVLPSRQESAPLAVVEAMFCGRPVVATDVGGVREWVEEGQTGFVAEAPMPFYLGAALERAWQRRGDWPQLGRQGHDKAAVQAGDHPGRVLLGALTGNGARACPMA